jgi:hypothetical protein
MCVAFPFLPTELFASTPTLCRVTKAVLCAYAAKLHVSNAHLVRKPEQGAYEHPVLVAMILHLLKASNNKDQISGAERRFGGDSVKWLVVGLKGHDLGWRLVVSLLRIFIVGFPLLTRQFCIIRRLDRSSVEKSQS